MYFIKFILTDFLPVCFVHNALLKQVIRVRPVKKNTMLYFWKNSYFRIRTIIHLNTN